MIQVRWGRSIVVVGVAAVLGIAMPAFDALSSDLEALKDDYRRPETIPFSQSNPYTPQKAELGKTLYFDPRLSRVGALSCASCHNASFGWEDGRPKAIGDRMEAVGRHSPTILNLAWGELFFWDGRAHSLEEQALGPIEAAGEMNLPLPEMAKRLSAIAGYRDRFDDVFPDKGLTVETVSQAIATFERTVVSGQAPFDAWIEGDETAISEEAKRGFALFNGKMNCSSCHSGWRFTDDSFHDIGLADEADAGRGALFPEVAELRHTFKTPGLRNISQRAPFMHDGSIDTLDGVVRHYASGVVQRPSTSEELSSADLSEDEVADLVAFLGTLTSADRPMAVPVLP